MKYITVSIGLLLAGLLLLGCGRDGSAVIIEADAMPKTEDVTESTTVGTADEAMPEAETAVPETTPSWVYVHICGQVKEPGLYRLSEGSRVWDAVESAGGFTEAADPEAVNLAFPVVDGCKITIPEQGDREDGSWWETGSGGINGEDNASDEVRQNGLETVKGEDPGLVNINCADMYQLMTLSGIGEAKARAIIAYRELHGDFNTIEEIMQVEGIKEGLFSKIKSDITVGG